MTISYPDTYSENAPLRLLRRDPNDYTRLVVHNQKNGMVDDGQPDSEKPEHCYNCNTPDSLLSSVSLHFCKCGVIFNYWAGGGNAKWHVHYRKLNEYREAQSWYEADEY